MGLASSGEDRRTPAILSYDSSGRPGEARNSGSTAHICVIDGDTAVRDSLVTLLTLNGHEATGFSSGEAFLHYLRQEPRRCIDCVICEAELPDTTGLELFTLATASDPGLRFALLTSRNDQATAAAARRHGIDAVFPKPLVSRRLREFVRRI